MISNPPAAADGPGHKGTCAELGQFCLAHCVAVYLASAPAIAAAHPVLWPVWRSLLGLVVVSSALGVALPRARRPALALVMLFGVAQGLVRLPASANHEMLGVLVALTLVLASEGTADEREAERALRGLLVAVLVWSALQKLLAGTWIRGTYLAWALAGQERFSTLGLFLPRDELARLSGLQPDLLAAGPFVLHSWQGLAISNGVWLMELLLPWGLLARRTRAASAWLLLIFILVIQVMAREWFFAGLMAALLLQQTSPRLRRWGLLAIALAYGPLLWLRLT